TSPTVSTKWANIGTHYRQAPDDLLMLLPAMAAVHILDDLESVLFFVDVEAHEYDAIVDEILHCLDTTDFLGHSASLSALAFDYLVNRWARHLRNAGIAALRLAAQ